MRVATAPPRAVADQVMGAEGSPLVVRCVDLRRVKSGKEPKYGYMQDPDAIKIDEEMWSDRAFLKVCLEKDAIPVDVTEFHKTLGRWYID